MPQMREVMSGASPWSRPRSSASKKRGGSKMRNSTFSIVSPLTLEIERALALDPGERVDLDDPFTHGVRLSSSERRGAGVEAAVKRADPRRAGPGRGQLGRQRRGVRGFLRPEAAVAAAPHRRAEVAAARLGHRAEARRCRARPSRRPCPARLHSMHCETRGTCGLRPTSVAEISSISWGFETGQPRSSKSTVNMVGDGGRGRQRVDIVRMGVDRAGECLDIGEVAQRLDAARGGAGADRDQGLRLGPDLADPLGIMRGGDRPLDQRDVIGPVGHRAGRFEKLRDVERAGDCQQLVLAIEDLEAGSRRRTRTSTPRAWDGPSLRSPSGPGAAPRDRSGRPDRRGRRNRGRTGNGRRSRRRISCCAPSRPRCSRPPPRRPRGPWR